MSQSGGITFSQVAEDVVVIAVMGVTGSGKSTFVKLLTGSKSVEVGADLTSCTKKPSLHECTLDGVKMILIDTPGFDDTFLSDADVLQEVASCLQMTYVANMKLTGIIYMHRIIDPRLTHGGMRNLAMFRKLCGTDPMKNVVLATSFWGKVTPEEGAHRENQLRTKPEFWGEMVEEGARMARFENNKASGLTLVKSLLKKGRVSLQIQKEMCDEGIPLAQTQAGEQVNEELAEMARRHAEEMQRLQSELQDALKAQDVKMQTTLKRELTKSERKMQQMQAQQEALKEDRRNEIRVLEQEFDRRLRRVESEKKEEADTMLKEKLAAARRQDKRNQANQQQQQSAQKPEKKRNYVKYLKIGGAATATALSIASCVINPFNAGSAVSSFVHLVNLVFSDSSSDVSSLVSGGGFADSTDGTYDDEDYDVGGAGC